MAGPRPLPPVRYLISGEAEEHVKAAASMVIDKQISLLSNDKPAPLEHKGNWLGMGAMGHDMGHDIHRIGWWENLQDSPIFDGKNHGFL